MTFVAAEAGRLMGVLPQIGADPLDSIRSRAGLGELASFFNASSCPESG
jgi:hypothetical protein